MNLAGRAEYFGRWQPDSVAIRAGERDVTWRELADSVARVARGLSESDVGPGDRVGILGANSVEWCVLALAAMHCGAILVPLNIRLAPPELKMIATHSGCRAVAVDEQFESLLDRAELDYADLLRISLDGVAKGEVTVGDLAQSTPAELTARAEDDAAVIGYTSGTTGLPKGVILTHANIAACALQTALAEGSTLERRTLLCIPLAFTGGVVNNFLATYTVGGTLVLEPSFVPDRVLEMLEQERITTWFAVPIMWQAVASVEGFAEADLSHLSTAICGGAPVPGPLLEAYHRKGVAVRQAYGLTEATGSTCLLPATMAAHPTAAGMPNVHTELRLVDDDLVDVPLGEVGEIIVRGPQVMGGYWNDPTATAAAIRDGWLLTGDLARMLGDDLIEIVDRKKSMFISGGLNVYPAEIERVVDLFPGVAECAAFGLPHERFGEACAVVVRCSGERVDEEQLVLHCRAELADYKSPRSVFFLDEPLPRGMSGKILRNEIVARFAPRSGEPSGAVS